MGLAELARIAARWQLPASPLFLLAGLAFGRGGVLPVITAGEFIELGAEIGVILLLFMLGLEYSGDESTAGLRRHAPAGVVDLGAQLHSGLRRGLFLGWSLISAVFLGGITYVSSSGIVARLLDDLGVGREPGDAVVLSILVIEDLVMAGYLSLIAVLVGGSAGGGALTVVVALGAVAALLIVARRWGHVVSDPSSAGPTRPSCSRSSASRYSWPGLAEQVGISAAVGAFLVGLMLSGPAAEHAQSCSARCVTCSPRSSSCFSACRSTPRQSRRSSAWPCCSASSRPPRRC